MTFEEYWNETLRDYALDDWNDCYEVALRAWNYQQAIIDGLEAELKRKTEWQPIETAPRDGTVFDVWVGLYSRRVADCVMCKQWGRVYAYNPESGYYDQKISGATHWMPLPPPPLNEKPT